MKSLFNSLLFIACMSTSALAQIQPQLPYLSRAYAGQVANCSVVQNGPYYQLYTGTAFQFSGNYLVGSQDFALDYRIQTLVQYGQCVVYDPYYIQSKLNLAITGQLGACQVIPSAPYNQLFIAGQFRGNYPMNKADATLTYILDRSPSCQYNPNTQVYIQNARTGRYAGCYVTIAGQYNQLYVNGIFRGNFLIGYDDARLTSILINGIQAGVCRPIY